MRGRRHGSGGAVRDLLIFRREAAAAGFCKPEGDQDFRRAYPKIQILTVEDLFDGKRPKLLFIDASVFRKVKRETTASQGKLEV